MASPDLAAYLREQAGRPFKYGTSDCCCFIACWVWECRGIDAMPYFGGYRDKAEADALLAQLGGLTRAVGRALRQAGVLMTQQPQAGDIAIVKNGDVTACAIRTERFWAMRLDTGRLALVPPESVRVIAAWKL